MHDKVLRVSTSTGLWTIFQVNTSMLIKIECKPRPWQSQQFPVSISCSWWLIFRGRTKWFMWCLIFKVCLTLDFKFTEYRNVPSFFRPKPNCRQNCSIGRESWSPLLPCCRLSVAWCPLTPFPTCVQLREFKSMYNKEALSFFLLCKCYVLPLSRRSSTHYLVCH